jgi:rRNA maturation endonuclease Nob1
MIYILLFILILILVTKNSTETFDNDNHKIQCYKWKGDIESSPANICKDCGYPIDCHGPYKGDSWRHIFRETQL